MKCPYCLTENTDGNFTCEKCGEFLLHSKKLSEKHIDHLIEKGCIQSFDELMQLKDISVSCRCDDGMGLPPGLEIELELPLYYTENDIIAAVKRKGVCPDVDSSFFSIDEFHDRMSEHTEELGSVVLAEAVADNIMKLMLHVVVYTRQYNISQKAI